MENRRFYNVRLKFKYAVFFFFFILPSSKRDLRVSNLCPRASNDNAITAMLTTSSLKAYCYVQNCACVFVFFYYEGSKVGLL